MKTRVLVIDDEQGILLTLREYLELFGYEVVTADNPTICSSLREDRNCTQKAPCADIVLVDMHMPIADGMAYLESRIRYGCPNLVRRMALISGNLSPQDEIRLHQTGAACFHKPVPLAEIREWIERVLAE